MNIVTLGKEGIASIQKGVDTVANAVKVTLGAAGQNVIIEKQGAYPHITKDGVTVARSITLSNRLENMGAAMVIQAANKTVEQASDGTTTTAVLVQAIIRECLLQINNGVSPTLLKKGMDAAYQDITKQLKANAVETKSHDKLRQVATISGNNDTEIGDLLFEALGKVTSDGIIKAEISKTGKTYVDHVAGVRIDKGYTHPYFVNDLAKNRCHFDAPYVMIVNDTISLMADMVGIIDQVYKENRPLLIITKDVEGEALATLAINARNNGLKVCVILAPSQGSLQLDIMDDLCYLTGAKVVGHDSGIPLKTVTKDHLGVLESCTITDTDSTFIGGKGSDNNIKILVSQLKSQLKEDKTEEQKEILKGRIAKINGGVAVINVGGATEMEMIERKDRIDDAIGAVKAAAEEGIIIGGGAAFLKLKAQNNELKGDERVGYLTVFQAIKAPFLQILENAGDRKNMLDKIINNGVNQGYNVLTERVEDFMESGVVDPVKVLRVALENSVSVAGIFITTGAVISYQ